MTSESGATSGPREAARRGDWWGRDPRSWALLFAANVYLSRVLAYFPGVRRNEPLPTGLATIAQVMPREVFGIFWLAALIGLVVVAVWRIPAARWQVLLVAPPFMWAGLYLVGAIAEGSLRAFWAFDLFASFGGMVAASLLKRPSPPGPRQ